MNPVTRYKPLKHPNPPCPDLMVMAERELSAFFKTVTQLFGSEQAELSARDWLREFVDVDRLPSSAREWCLITAKASTRLASRVSNLPLLTEVQGV